MTFSSLTFLIAFLFRITSTIAFNSAEYHEDLLLKPLPSSALLASFTFRSNATLDSFENQNFRHFPRSLGQILEHAKTKELHLRFSSGRWDAESFGARPRGGRNEGGTGVELWAWIDADDPEGAFASWITLNHALSGLFCASLNFIDSTKTTRPVMTFEPQGTHAKHALPCLHLLHGTLPHEVVCTENLTPFLKLLPCKGKAGISSLLDGHKLFDASWQSMAIDVRPICPEGSSSCVVEMVQTVDMVLDIERSKRPRDNPIPRPIPREEMVCDNTKPYASNEACFPLDAARSQSWTLSEIFGRNIKGTCLADPDVPPVCIDVPHERRVLVAEGALEHKLDSGHGRCFTLPSDSAFEMSLPHQPDLTTQSPLSLPLLYAERSFTGHGQERGGMQALLTNPSPAAAIDFVYLESLPWFMKPYLHTLKAQVSGRKEPILQSDVIKDVYYKPAVDRRRGTQLELRISVPPASTVALTYAFEKAILRYTEYPPDANRGFDVAPAVIRLVGTSEANTTQGVKTHPASPPRLSLFSEPIYLRTTSLLLPLPTPDFSMPYNVIILTSTVMALAFGSVFTMLVRRFVAADEAGEPGLVRLRGLVVQGLGRLRTRLKGSGLQEKEKKEQ